MARIIRLNSIPTKDIATITVKILPNVLNNTVRRGNGFEKTNANVRSSFSPEMESKANSRVTKLKNIEMIKAQVRLSERFSNGLTLLCLMEKSNTL